MLSSARQCGHWSCSSTAASSKKQRSAKAICGWGAVRYGIWGCQKSSHYGHLHEGYCWRKLRSNVPASGWINCYSLDILKWLAWTELPCPRGEGDRVGTLLEFCKKSVEHVKGLGCMWLPILWGCLIQCPILAIHLTRCIFEAFILIFEIWNHIGGIIFNPLSPSIHIQILQTDLHTFP